MKIFKKFKFLNRFTKIPRSIFTQSKAINLTKQNLDIIFKLLNFYIDNNEITPNLTKLSERSWISIRTYQRAFSCLKEKGYIEINKRKDLKGKFTTNSYKLDSLFSKIDSLSNQLYIDFESNNIFWAKSSTLANCSFIAVPKALDFFQKEIDLWCEENLFLKYLFWYLDDDWISEVSLNIIAKTTPLTRKSLQRAVVSLQEKGLIKVSEQFYARTKIRVRNRYDLKPLLKKLNTLERLKVENKLKEKGIWKDFTKERKYRTVEVKQKEIKKKESTFNNRERIAFLKNEIGRLQPQLRSKYSEIAELIRQHQLEINELKFSSAKENSIANLVKKRLKNIKPDDDVHSDVWYRAKMICEKLNWNWNKSFNLYIKAVKKLPWTVDRFMWYALEKGVKKERYFATCVSKEFRKLELI